MSLDSSKIKRSNPELVKRAVKEYFFEGGRSAVSQLANRVSK